MAPTDKGMLDDTNRESRSVEDAASQHTTPNAEEGFTEVASDVADQAHLIDNLHYHATTGSDNIDVEQLHRISHDDEAAENAASSVSVRSTETRTSRAEYTRNNAEDIESTYAKDEKQGCINLAYPLPMYDQGTCTKWFCLVALVLTHLLGLACVVAASVSFHHPMTSSIDFPDITLDFPDIPEGSTTATAQLPPGLFPVDGPITLYGLLLTFLVTCLTEAIGRIHSVFLRWCRFHEQKLKWNSDLRLFTTSSATWATSPLSNLLYFLSLAVAYTSASQILINVAFVDSIGTHANFRAGVVASGTALASLGASLLVQAILTSWLCITGWKYVKTWSSNPLNNALAMIHHNQPSRCADKSSLSTAAERSQKPTSCGYEQKKPSYKQPNLLETRGESSLAVLSAWILAIATTIWATGVLIAWGVAGITPTFKEFLGDEAKINELNITDSDWSYVASIKPWGNPFKGLSETDGYMLETHNMQMSKQIFVSLFIVFLIQIGLTLTLHCAEIVLLPIRDQESWADAAGHLANSKNKSQGAKLNPNPIKAFWNSKSTLVLTLGKTLAHWLFSKSLTLIVMLTCFQCNEHNRYPDAGDTQWTSMASFIFLFGVPSSFLAIVLSIIAGYVTYLASKHPKGPQPSTYGHYETLIHCIDDWADGETLFWGDKRKSHGKDMRYAGTASDSNVLGKIDFSAEYQ